MPSEQEVFTEALAFTEAAARTEYLDRVCGSDSIKRQRLNELLTLHESADSVLDRRPQEMIESLSDSLDQPDSTLQPGVTLAALKPFLEPATQPASLGRLSHYELLEILGQGGYGIVFKAMDTKLVRLVAVKILSPHLALTSPPRRRFLREARAAAAVRHEHVVQIYAVEESPIPYLVMEFVSGETLQQRSDRIGPFEPVDVVLLGQQIARGLAAAHEQGLIHRDIKPGNILIADGMEPIAKLSDFGLARTADDASRSQSGIVVGTPMYMSPEQVAGDEVDQRTDLFSFGSVLYLMVSGRPPFRAPSTLAVLKRVAEEKPRSIRDVIPDVPVGLCSVISRLHSKSREERFSTAGDVESALKTCLTQPVPTWRNALQRVILNRPRRVAGLSAIVLLFCTASVLISESTGFSSFFKHQPAMKTARSEEPTSIVTRESSSPGSSVTLIDQGGVGAPPEDKTAELVQLTEWDKAVARMTADDQITTVRAKLMQLNPMVQESWIQMRIGDTGTVESISFEQSVDLTDISPLRALRGLKSLRIGAGSQLSDLSPLQGIQLEAIDLSGQPVRDLSPLKGMPLKTLGLWCWRGDDLSPLRGMKLINCNFGGGGPLRDLEPLRGMRLEMACFNETPVEDLSPLKGMPLRRLEIQHTQVTSLAPLTDSPLEFLATEGSPVGDFSPLKASKISELRLDYDAARDKAALQNLAGLQILNGRPAADFLASH